MVFCGFAHSQSADKKNPAPAPSFLDEHLADVNSPGLEKLLSGYLENDLDLQKYILTAKSKALSLDSTKIDNGFDIQLESGTVKITSSADKTKITLSPGGKISLPAARGLEISADFPLTIEDGEKTLEDGTISSSIEIVGNTAAKRKVELLKAERELLEARRNAQDRAVEAEKDFYTELKNLYGYAVTVLEKRADLYDDTKELEKLISQGYAKTSSSYRRADLAVQSDRRDIEENVRKLERETAVFAKKCGLDYSAYKKEKMEESERRRPIPAVEFLPNSIPSVEALDVKSFDSDSYTKSESAAWDSYIGDLERKSDSSTALKAKGGYTFNNSFSDSDTVDSGLSLEWRGLTASAGVSFPVDSDFKPFYTLSLAIDPNEFRKASIDKKQDKLNEELERVAVKSAALSYETDTLDKQTSLSDIQWAAKSYAEEYEMYKDLESDLASWYEQGIVTESDWLDARNNRDKARLNMLIEAIKLIIYNDETKLLFHNDSGLTQNGAGGK